MGSREDDPTQHDVKHDRVAVAACPSCMTPEDIARRREARRNEQDDRTGDLQEVRPFQRMVEGQTRWLGRPAQRSLADEVAELKDRVEQHESQIMGLELEIDRLGSLPGHSDADDGGILMEDEVALHRTTVEQLLQAAESASRLEYGRTPMPMLQNEVNEALINNLPHLKRALA